MKILVVSQFYTPDITAAAFRISETVTDLKQMGNEVEVVSTFPHKSKNLKKIPASKNGIHRLQLPDTENKGFLGYIYLYFSFMVKSILKGFLVGRKLKPDVIWASSPPIFVGLAGWMLAKLLRSNFALDIRDIWPDSAVAAGQISDSGFAFNIGRWMERFLYKNADVITCVATPMKQYIQQYTDTKVVVIYNGVDVSSGVDANKNGRTEFELLDEIASSKESKKILYAGNFGHVQQLDLLIEALAEFNSDGFNNQWEIFFLGGGVQKENLTALVESYGLSDKIHFHEFVPKKKVFDYLKSADVLFIHLQDSDVLRLTIPSKVFDYMLADRPLLAGIYGEGKDILQSVDGNLTFKSGNKASLLEALKTLEKNLSLFQEEVSNAKVVKSKFSRRSQSEKLNNLFYQEFA